jgi:hypothetical protein
LEGTNANGIPNIIRECRNDLYKFAGNSEVTWEEIIKNKWYEHPHSHIDYNPNLTWKHVYESHKSGLIRWRFWDNLSENTFDNWNAALVIQRRWRQKIKDRWYNDLLHMLNDSSCDICVGVLDN